MTKSMEAAKTKASQEKKEADLKDLIEDIVRLQKQNEELRRKLHEATRRPSITIAYYIIFVAGSALTVSIYINSSPLTLIGLGMFFFGVTLLATRPTKHTTRGQLDATAISSMKAFDRLVLALDYKGKPVYLPPPTSEGESEAKVFIPGEPGNRLPPETETAGNNLITKNPEGLSLTPPGEALADLFEERLGASFVGADLDYVESCLPKLVKDLGLAKKFMLDELGNTIHVKIEGSAHASLCAQLEKETRICETLGCPLISAIAIVLARTTHEPITIDAVETSNEGKTIEAWYGLLET